MHKVSGIWIRSVSVSRWREPGVKEYGNNGKLLCWPERAKYVSQYSRQNSRVYFLFRGCALITNGYFCVEATKTSEWTHIVLNYIGPNDGQGIQIYQDGVLARNQTIKMAQRACSRSKNSVTNQH